jgi:hypothetical protein
MSFYKFRAGKKIISVMPDILKDTKRDRSSLG